MRPYQLDALDAIRSLWARGKRSLLLELPTGTGKTVVFARLVAEALRRGERALIVVHREDLATQALAKLADLGVRAEVERGKLRASSHARCVVASVDSLQRARLAAYPPNHFGLVVIDEGHHAPAPKYEHIRARFSAARELLVTATAKRLDGKPLGVDAVAFRYPMFQAIADEWLCPLQVHRVRVAGLDLDNVETKGGDFKAQSLGDAMRSPTVLAQCCAWILERIGTLRTIAFCVDTAHCRAVVAALNAARPGTARAVYGEHTAEERAAALRAWRAGDITVLVNCELYTEGFDEPSVEAIALLRPTKSGALFTQMVGRGARLWPRKKKCIVLDISGNTLRHKLASAVDALLGDLPVADAVLAEVARILEREGAAGSRRIPEILQEAERTHLASEARKVEAVILEFRARIIDPFLEPHYQVPITGAVLAGQPASKVQLAKLEELGIASPPPGVTMEHATAWINAAHARSRHGLCTLKMALWLARWGIDAKRMTRERAKRLFVEFKAMGAAAFKVHAFRQPEWRAKR